MVGILVSRFLPERRPQVVAEVIEANALLGGRMSSRVGVMAAHSRALVDRRHEESGDTI